MNQHKKIGQILQFEDMYGNIVGDDNDWHAHVRDVLFGKDQWEELRDMRAIG